MSFLGQIKILHIFGKMQHGGAEMRTLDIMRNIDRDKYKFYFCSLSGERGELDEEVRKMGGDVFYCNYRNILFPIKFIRILKKYKFNVVHSHVHTFSGLILFFSYLAQVPKRIAHFRNTNDNEDQSTRKRFQRKIMKKLINKYATNILAVCNSAMEIAWSKDWKDDSRCKVIYNGIDINVNYDIGVTVREEFNINDSSEVIIHVGRMEPQKNHIRVIEIFKEIHNQLPSSILILVGKGKSDIEKQIKEMVQKFGLQNNVIFTGIRNDVPRLLAASDLLLFPSKWEGLPGVVLEASSVGLPTLATDLPGVQEIASYISSVNFKRLSLSTEEWAIEAIKLIKKNRTTNKELYKREFFASPFNLDICILKLVEIWERTEEETLNKF